MSIAMRSIREELCADCSRCFGLCCAALHIVESSEFAMNKPAGTPCSNLCDDYRCSIHSRLRDTGFKGCTVYDCMGAGQHICQVTFEGHDWREFPELAKPMFQLLPIMEQVHEMIAYVAEALSYPLPSSLSDLLQEQLQLLRKVTQLKADVLLTLNMIDYRIPVNELLLEASRCIRGKFQSMPPTSGAEGKRKGKRQDKQQDKQHVKLNLDYRGVDWAGKQLQGRNLSGADFRGACFIAANLQHADLRGADFIGADLRDADVRGSDLSNSLFLTQMQINSARGSFETKLPAHLQRPAHWV